MARCPACGTVVSPGSTSCYYCRAVFQAPAPEEPVEDRPEILEFPFGASHRKLAGVFGTAVSVSLFGAVAWWLWEGLLGPGTTDSQWFGVAIFVSLNLVAVRAFFRIRNGKPASFGPYAPFHTQMPVAQRTVVLCFHAILCIAMLAYLHFNVLR